jgi:membrane protein implicated in regulation of membrane protease activity
MFNDAMAQELVGLIGTVSHAIRGGRLPGEVKVSCDGSINHFIAFCDHALPQGTQVLVVHNRGARQVDVEPWTDPVLGVTDAG